MLTPALIVAAIVLALAGLLALALWVFWWR